MKTFGIIVFAVTFVLATAAQMSIADETIGEGVTASAKTAKRAAVKGAHRTQEAICPDGELECGATKVKNRAMEAKAATVDKAEELKNKID